MIVVISLLGWSMRASAAGADRNHATIAKPGMVFAVPGRESEVTARKTASAGLPTLVFSAGESWKPGASKRWTSLQCEASRPVRQLRTESWRERGPPAN